MSVLSAPLPASRRDNCQNARPATSTRPASAPACAAGGSARRRRRAVDCCAYVPECRSTGPTTASAQANAVSAATHQAVAGEGSSRTPALDSAP
ncbi:hypothetical protein [Actinacidiphila glaucinigra]